MPILMNTVDPAKAKAFFEAEMAFTTGPVELDRMLRQREDLVVVDVREPEDYAQGHIPGAINLPKAQWGNLQGLHKERNNIVYCYSMVCHLAKAAALEFSQKGYPVMEMDGGFAAWKEHELAIER